MSHAKPPLDVRNIRFADIGKDSELAEKRRRNIAQLTQPEAPTHLDVLAGDLANLYASGAASDCTLVSHDGMKFAVHWAILLARSPMLASDMKKKACRVCRLVNVDGKAMEALLKYLYTGSLSGIKDFVEEMLDLADQYAVPDLVTACDMYMRANLRVSKCEEYMDLAKRRGLYILESMLSRFMGNYFYVGEKAEYYRQKELSRPEVPFRHPEVLVRDLVKLYRTGTAADCTLVSCDGQKFAAHRAILSARSPVFARMFATDMKEKLSGLCRMENVDGKTVDALLNFLYTGTLSSTGECLVEMLDLADQYELPDLAVACEEYMGQNVQITTAEVYMHLAECHKLHALKSKLVGFIAFHSQIQEKVEMYRRNELPQPEAQIHLGVLGLDLAKLYGSGTASDCTLVSRDGKEFAAHRLILSARSPVFARMFAPDEKKQVSAVCRMENVDAKAVDALLIFLYTASLSGIGELVEDMLGLADQYELPDLAAACETYMVANVQVSTAFGYASLAERRGLHALKSKLARFIADHSGEF